MRTGRTRLRWLWSRGTWVWGGALAGALCAGCGGGRILEPTPVQVARAEARWDGCTPDELAEGRRLFAVRCTSCHTAPLATRVPDSGWANEVSRMGPRAHLEPAQMDLVARYLATVSEP